MSRPAHRENLLALLADHCEHTQNECLQVGGFRYGARLFELRGAGHRIITIPHGESEYAYRLLRDHEPDSAGHNPILRQNRPAPDPKQSELFG